MKTTKRPYIALFLLATAFCLLAIGCSTQQNTARSRWWHAFNAKYNTYYNGTLAYIDASLEKEQGNKDNYTEMIPLYTVGNKNTRELGKANYDRAIEKCKKAIQLHSIKRRPEWTKNRRKTQQDIEWLNRKEYNPFLWKAWMLMGRSQFFQGDFEGAATTFAYMSRLYSTQPPIYGKARAWLAKSYAEAGWIYDAEDVIRNMERDSIHWSAQKEWDYTYADYYIHTGDFKRAIPYLRKVIRHEMRRKQKAREWFLLGQLEASLGNRKEAYKAFKHVIRLNPPYELEFNARIAMSEVMASDNDKKMIGKLRRMAKSDKNQTYLDQVYYAIGNIYLARRDTANAIAAYEKGNTASTRNGIEKGVLLLRLANLYWEKESFSDAQRCYSEALGMVDKERKDFPQMTERSKILDKLVPYTEAIHLQDSLQALAQMGEEERNNAIDRVIEALKRKEKEERYLQAEEQSLQGRDSGSGLANFQRNTTAAPTTSNSSWYFYNPMAVSQGKTAFQRQWGKRENADNWQRSNKTVVALQEDTEDVPSQPTDSLQEADVAPQENQPKESNDPHQREYYMAQIPFSQEQLDESNKILAEGLLQAGIIFKDKLDNLGQSEKKLKRLVQQFPDYAHIDDAYYHLYLLYARKNMPSQADAYIDRLKAECPNSQWTALLSDPYYKENALFGIHIEDSLYAATYDAFKVNKLQEVRGNALVSEKRFPQGANRDKFLFIGGLAKLYDGDTRGCLEDMKHVVEKYPNSRISEIAGMIINGVSIGKRLYGGKFDLEQVWTKRNAILSEENTMGNKQISEKRDTAFVFLYVYEPDSVNENQLLFEMAKFNFTTYMVRNFDIQIEDLDGLHRMAVTGFRNYDEAWQYAKAIDTQPFLKKQAEKCKSFIISQPNMELIGKSISYADYEKYYDQHLSTLKVSKDELLNEPTDVILKPANSKQQGQDDEFYIEGEPNEKSIPSEDININIDDEYYDLEGF